MRSRYFKINSEAEINITPMLDVVFIMLIFFIVTTSFTKEIGLAIYKSSQSGPYTKSKNAIIKLDSQNNHSVNNISTTLDGIGSQLANLKASNPEIGVQILSSKEVKTGDLVHVLHQIKSNDIAKYSVSSY